VPFPPEGHDGFVSISRWSLDSEADDLTALFARRGVTVSSAVPAFTGLYPSFGGRGYWELLFTRHRLLARTADGIQEWSAWGGPTPGRLLKRDDAAELLVVVRRRRRYDRVLVAGRRFWVHRRYRQTVTTWASPDAEPAT
jgi:hypothetical protein